MAKLGMRLVFVNIVMNPLAEMTYGKNNLRISKPSRILTPHQGQSGHTQDVSSFSASQARTPHRLKQNHFYVRSTTQFSLTEPPSIRDGDTH